MPAGRAEALPLEFPDRAAPELVPEPEAPDAEPVVLPVLPMLPVEELPLALVWLLSRAMLLLTSQH